MKPIQGVWRDLQDALARIHFPHLEAPQDSPATRLQAYEAAMGQVLTDVTSLVEASHALGS